MEDTRACWQCGSALAKKPGPGRWPRYCSPECKVAARPRTEPRGPHPAECAQCGGDFEARGRGKFCSGPCRAKFSREHDPEYHAKQRARGALRVAPRSYVAFILCAYCDRIACVRRPLAVRCREPECRLAHRAAVTAARRERDGHERLRYGYTEATAAAYHRRRALKMGATVEKFNHSEIYDRDGWICGICSKPVDRDLKWPEPMSVSLDHVIPLAFGGDHSRANTQCSHLSCNVRKGARVASP